MTAGRAVNHSRFPETIPSQFGERFFGVFDTPVKPKH
jgi:hypothetical protein